jgi:probable F420-dependent oxidoreductase
MRHGLILTAASIQEQVDVAKRADDAGFHSVWTTEFFNAHGFVRLAAVAAATRNVKLGTGIAYAFMRTPMLAASAAMDIDELSGGRMILGLGSGTRTMNERWYSMPFDAPPAPRMGEAIGLIRAAIDAAGGGGLRFEGKYYNVDIPQYSRSGLVREKIPIYVAAVNRGMIRTAARVADGLVGHPIYTRKYMAERVLPELEGSSCELTPFLITSIGDDPDRARDEARAQIGFYYSTRLYHTVLEPHGWQSIGEEIAQAFRRRDYAAMANAVTDEMVDAIAIAGRPDEARDKLHEWRDLTDHVLLYSPSVGMGGSRLRDNVDAIIDTFKQSG